MRLGGWAALALVLLAGGGSWAQTVPAEPPPMRPGEGQVAPRMKGPPRIGDDLVGTRWQAQTVRGRAVPQEWAPTLEFLEDGFIRGETGCNRYVGPFATRADRGVLGPLSRTKMACTQALDQQEATFIETLERTERMELKERNQVLLLYSSLSDQPSRFARLP